MSFGVISNNKILDIYVKKMDNIMVALLISLSKLTNLPLLLIKNIQK